MITENLSTLKIHKLTKAQYERELEAGNIDENALYLTPDEVIDLSAYATIEHVNTKADASHAHNVTEINGAMPNMLIENYHYGSDFPEGYVHSENTKGRIFFKKVVRNGD